MSETAVVKKTDSKLAEYGSKDDLVALGKRVQSLLPGGNKMTMEQAMAVAQYAILMDANPFRGEIYGGEIAGKFTLMEGYKLLVRWAKNKCPYSEQFRPLAIEELPAGAIGYECLILREDARPALSELTQAGASFQEAYEIVATSAVGVVNNKEMFKGSRELYPPNGWTWDQVARKRALKNALNLSHGAPSPRDISNESWRVEDVDTEPEDWVAVPPEASPSEREKIVLANVTARKAKARIGEMTDEERLRFLGESRALLRGTQDDIDGNLVRPKPEQQDDNESDLEPRNEGLEWAEALTTSQGTSFGELSTDQLTWIIEHPEDATDNQVKAAGILLDEMIPF